MNRSDFTHQHTELRGLLLARRKASGLTQNALAARLGRPQSYVSKYERGEQHLDVFELMAICACLKVDVPTVLSELVVRPPQPRRMRPRDANH